ncbi:cardiolipin synthase [Robiginitalea sp. M366]|uniref:cardiolipin synthase n=1 Tax=Robiginitalea aestuariiviva TaxID=3036903 RepID=UPI00240D2FA4|nr:cardiolipin synthase [Robiginitalea aestuariiviva]MDG1572453.1 cardiolipin synthase [Robiginitalea aestuariiviva]
MWAKILIVLYILLAISIVISLLLNGVRPSKTLAWLLAIFTIPVGGIFLYLLVGRNRRKQKVYQQVRRAPPTESGQASPPFLKADSPSGRLHRLLASQSGFPISADNEVGLLKDGAETFTRVFEALEQARETIHVQYYIFEEGELAERLLHLFVEKEAQGVQVRLIYDSVGSYSLSPSYLKRLRQAGIEVYAFLPFRLGKFLTSVNYRNHRKIIVVDGKVAFTGGINISDKYLKGDADLGMWHDMNLILKGTAAAHLDTVFINDWELVTRKKIPLPQFPSPAPGGKATVQILASGPDDDFPLMEQLYFSLINHARHHIYITNPYLIPSQAIQLALQTAALGGVDVRILVSAKADSALVSWCVRSYFQRFLKSGVKIYQYPQGFLHSKCITVDDRICTVGTANMDNRSFQHNYEVNALIYDSQTAIRLREDFLADSAKSIALDLESFSQRPWTHRLLEGAARTLSPVL